MTYSESFAIVDMSEKSESYGKILVLLDDEVSAQDFVQDLRRHHLEVVVRRAVRRRGVVVVPDELIPRSA